MCELKVYTIRGNAREKVMDGVVRLFAHNGKVLMEGIFGDSMEVEGRIAEVDMMAQSAIIVAN
jgi:predicted RNA-binding protein